MAGTPLRRGNKPCGAYARSTGQACRNTATYPNGRCRNHGGLAKGPTSEEGKARAIATLMANRGPLTEEGRLKVLAGGEKGRAIARENQRKRIAERKAEEAFRQRYTRASWTSRSRTP